MAAGQRAPGDVPGDRPRRLVLAQRCAPPCQSIPVRIHRPPRGGPRGRLEQRTTRSGKAALEFRVRQSWSTMGRWTDTSPRAPRRLQIMAETQHASVTWKGDLLTGAGTIDYVSSGVFSRMPVSWAARTGAHNGKTSPEELLAAAHASCFSMAFSARLAKNGTPATKLSVRAECALRQRDAAAGRSPRARSRSWATSPASTWRHSPRSPRTPRRTARSRSR